MITGWIPKRIVATQAGDVEVTDKPSFLAYLIAEDGVTVTLKNGPTQCYTPLVGPDEDDHEETPLQLNQGITLNFSGAGAATIKYRV